MLLNYVCKNTGTAIVSREPAKYNNFLTMFEGVVQAQVDQVVGEVPAAGGGLRRSKSQ